MLSTAAGACQLSPGAPPSIAGLVKDSPIKPGSGAHPQSVGTAAPAYTLERIWTVLPSSSGSTASMLPVMTPVELCAPICTDVMTGDWLKKPRRTNASKAHAKGDCPEGAVGDVPMTGPRTALKNPVTNLLMKASGPDVGSAAGSASFCVVVVDKTAGAADWVTGAPEDVSTVEVMLVVLLPTGAEGVAIAVGYRVAPPAAAETLAVIGAEVAVIADCRDAVGPFLPASGEVRAVTGPSADVTGATVPGT